MTIILESTHSDVIIELPKKQASGEQMVEQELANHNLQAKSGLPPLFVSSIEIQTCSFICVLSMATLVLPWQRCICDRDYMAHRA